MRRWIEACATAHPLGVDGVKKLRARRPLVAMLEDHTTDPMARAALLPLIAQLHDTQSRIAGLDPRILSWRRSNTVSRRLETIPGIGPITASAIVATITDPSLFRSGRQLAAWLGLVPRQNSSGRNDRLGHITKKGDGYIRRLLVIGAHAVLRFVRAGKNASNPWVADLIAAEPGSREPIGGEQRTIIAMT